MDTKIDLFKYLQEKMFLGVPVSKDMGDKFVIIGMLCQLYNVLRSKKPNVTMEQVVNLCFNKGTTRLEATTIEAIAAVCEWFAYGCEKFPDMGVPVKEIPNKIQSMMLNMVPF